ncbi:MAG: glycosyltransferase family 1 protein [Elusimicrobiota bacterium]
MKLAIINLTGGGMSGGHKSYIANILPRLAASDKIEKILCASPVGFKAETWIAPSPKLNLAVCEPFKLTRSAPDKQLKATLDAFRPDVVFVSIERHFTYPAAPIVTIVHNMAPLVSIKTTSGIREKLQSWARRFETGRAARGAAAVIAPTAFVREALVAGLGVEKEKVSLIHFGQSPVAAPIPPADKINDLFKEGFVFTAGSFEIYRGFEDLLRAFADIKWRYPGLKLVVAGGTRLATCGYKSRMETLAKALGLSRNVIWLGHVSQQELNWYYSHCSAFALTSRVESFCFVALEALAHGCNCIATESPCLPEILAEASLYYKAGDFKGLGHGLLEILARDNETRKQASRKAAERAARFSWDQAADETINLFLKVSVNRKS